MKYVICIDDGINSSSSELFNTMEEVEKELKELMKYDLRGYKVFIMSSDTKTSGSYYNFKTIKEIQY